MTYIVKILSFLAIEFFAFQLEAFQFSKFHENAAKLDKGNFKRDLKICQITEKSGFKFCKLHFVGN